MAELKLTNNPCKFCNGEMKMEKLPMAKEYPLHPGQTHAEPLYAQIPLEEYESVKRENKRLKEVLKRHGITLLKEVK